MNYYENFKGLTDDELARVLRDSELNYDARLQLRKILQEREDDVFTAELEELNNHLNQEHEDVKSLKYLKNIGFDHYEMDGRLEIRRSKTTRWIDILGLVLGILLCLLFAYGAFTGWQGIYQNGLTAGRLIGAFINTGLTVTGVLLIVKCLGRLLEFRRFRLIKDPVEGLFVYKHAPKGLVSGKISPDDIEFTSHDGQYAITYTPQNREPVQLIYTSAGPRSKATLEALFKSLR